MHLVGSETGMGLKLIRSLAAQLHGTLVFATPPVGAGTTVTLTIANPVPVRT